MFGLNYKDGMFLGKQELRRQGQLQDLYNNLLISSCGNISSPLLFEGLMDPRLSGLTIQEVISGNSTYIKVGVDPQKAPNASGIFGRYLVGFGPNGIPLGATLINSGIFTSSDFVDLSTIQDGDFYVLVESEETHWEEALINIFVDTNGKLVGVVTKGWDNVKDAIRTSANGKPSKILTKSGATLEISSFNTSTQTLYFSNPGGQSYSVNNESFAFLHSMSPYANLESGYLYTYPSLKISLVHREDLENGIPANKYLLGHINTQDNTVDITVYNSDTPQIEIIPYQMYIKPPFLGTISSESIHVGNLDSKLWPCVHQYSGVTNLSTNPESPTTLESILHPITIRDAGGLQGSLYVGSKLWMADIISVGDNSIGYLDSTPMLISDCATPFEFELWANISAGASISGILENTDSQFHKYLLKFRLHYGPYRAYEVMAIKAV